MLDRVVKQLITLLMILALGPSLIALVSDLLRDVLSPPPAPTPTTVGASAPAGSGLGTGVLVTLFALLLGVGILVRLGRALRNADAARYRAALDRRARMLPRYAATSSDVPAHATLAAPPDADPELPWHDETYPQT